MAMLKPSVLIKIGDHPIGFISALCIIISKQKPSFNLLNELPENSQ